MTAHSAISPRELLDHMGVPGYPGVYLVGALERRVTVYSQQVRALNLVYSLLEEKQLEPGDDVAVIGGGAAGLTAAAGAARRGCQVTIFEKGKALLHLFAGCTKRWLHPHIYDWPQPGSLRDDADDLEVLTWRASMAHNVVDHLRAQWEELRMAHNIKVLCGVTVNPLHPETSGQHPLVTWRPGANARRFRAIILAVGFGFERAFPGLPRHSYWHDDSLDQSDHEASKRFLVSGLGDGGLIEFVRACIGDFRHDQIVSSFGLNAENNPKVAALGDRLFAIEDDAVRHERMHGPGSAAERLCNAYTHDIDNLAGFVDVALATRIRDRKVLLNGIGPFPITRQASILNRLLAARLLHRQHADYWPGRLHTVSGTPVNGWQVTLEDGSSEQFHHVIIRHGTEPALDESFPAIARVCQRQLAPLGILDQTRARTWPSGYFSLNISRSVAPRQHREAPSNAMITAPSTADHGKGEPLRPRVGTEPIAALRRSPETLNTAPTETLEDQRWTAAADIQAYGGLIQYSEADTGVKPPNEESVLGRLESLENKLRQTSRRCELLGLVLLAGFVPIAIILKLLAVPLLFTLSLLPVPLGILAPSILNLLDCIESIAGARLFLVLRSPERPGGSQDMKDVASYFIRKYERTGCTELVETLLDV
jgi:hypothetical protein